MQVAVIVGVCCVAVALRLVDSPLSNFSAMAALALFSGAVIRHPAAVLLPLAMRAITDVLIHIQTGYGFFFSWPFDYFAYLLIALFAVYCVRPNRYLAVAGGSIVAVATYFVLSNFGVWAMSGMYPRTTAGLIDCFIMAIPFAKGTVLGNLIAVPVFFSAWNMLAAPSETDAATTGVRSELAAANRDT